MEEIEIKILIWISSAVYLKKKYNKIISHDVKYIF